MELDVVSSRMKRALAGQKLAQVCAPLFLYLTTFRRNSAASTLSEEEVRGSIEGLMGELEKRCSLDERLEQLLARVRYPIAVTIDHVIASSQWAERDKWAERTQESALVGSNDGGAQFFDQAREIQDEPGEDAAEAAEVLFICMGLGFQGETQGNKQAYAERRGELFEKSRVPSNLGHVLTPDSYGRNSGRALLKMPNAPLGRIILVALCTILSFVAIGYFITDIRSAATSAEVEELRAEIGLKAEGD